MLDVAVARARILQKLSSCGLETVPLTAACGRVLAHSVTARLSNPPVSVSSMDGYAARSTDSYSGATLTLIGRAPAGHPTPLTVQAGECVRVFTGSQIPEGADTVIIQENVHQHDKTVTLTGDNHKGQFIRTQGQDFAAGQCLLPAGKTLTARDIGLAAAAGHIWLTVARKPRVGILATGDEIILPGTPAQPDSIVNSGAFMVTALLNDMGAEAIMLPIAQDNKASLSAAFAHAAHLDLLVTLGGASVGTYDLVQETLKEHGLELDFWKIAMRPGKPLMSGQLGKTPLIGLPGNPVAAMVCTLVFVLPAIQALMGQTVAPELTTETAILGSDVKENDQRQDFLRGTLTVQSDGQPPIATPFSSQDSAQLNILAQSDVLILRAPFALAQKAGTACRILRLP